MSEIKWSGNRELQEKLKQLQAKSNKAAAGAITGLAFDVRQEVRNDPEVVTSDETVLTEQRYI